MSEEMAKPVGLEAVRKVLRQGGAQPLSHALVSEFHVRLPDRRWFRHVWPDYPPFPQGPGITPPGPPQLLSV